MSRSEEGDGLNQPLLSPQDDGDGTRRLSIAALATGRRSASGVRSGDGAALPTPRATATKPPLASKQAATSSSADNLLSSYLPEEAEILGGRAAGVAATPATTAGLDPEDAAAPRLSSLRFAPVPRPFGGGGASRVSSVSSGGGGRWGGSGGGGGTRLSTFSSMGVGKDTAVLHRSASNKLMQLSAPYQSRAQLQEEEGFTLPPGVIHPYDNRCGGGTRLACE
jgi:hypothetical protein